MDDEEQFKVSKRLLKTLTVDTRTDILKALKNRPMTASELSRKLDKHVTTVSEHLKLLDKSGLVERVERPGRKWVYYKLTKPGQRILHPTSYRWVFVLVVTFLSFVGGWYILSVEAYPGHWLYGLDRSLERLQLILTPSSMGRANLYIEHAEERLEEAKTAVDKGETEYATQAIRDYRYEMDKAKEEIEKTQEKKQNIVPTLEILSESTAKQKAILGNIATRAPEMEEEIQPALNISEEGRAMAVAELQNITGKSYD